MLKSVLFIGLLGVGQVGFAADIVCDDRGSVLTYSSSDLKSIGLQGLSDDLASTVANKVCDFRGVFQESWSATCFDKADLANVRSHGRIPGLLLSGYEHGQLYVSDQRQLNCQAL